jgi:RNA polymerase sigma-70 factor (ECF subfamily)
LPSSLSDEELAVSAQTQSGEAARHAFGELVQRFEGSLFGFLFVRVGNAATAEELVQDSFLRAWRKLHLYDPKHRFGTWLYTLARNLAVSGARIRRPSTVADEVLLHMPDGSDPTEQAAHTEELEGVWALAESLLSEESCSAMWLRYHDGLSNAEIGRILERPTVSVRVLLFRAREVLVNALREASDDEDADTQPGLRTGTISL